MCSDQTVYFCSVCISKLPKTLEKFTDSEDTQCFVGKQIETLQSQRSDLVAYFQQFGNKFNSNSGSQSLPSTYESIGTITAVSALQVIKEYRDRESHKLNVILHNVPESDSTETFACISHDTKIVADIAKVDLQKLRSSMYLFTQTHSSRCIN